MEIKTAVFKKGSVTVEDAFSDDLPHVAFIGRSNVGKSSTINAITKVKGLAKTSGAPGHTRQINLFLINNKFYIVDLPGYGFSKSSVKGRIELESIVESYLFNQNFNQQKVVLIIDGKIGPTTNDLDILQTLEQYGKNIVVAINKIDRLKNSEYKKQMDKIRKQIGAHTIVPYSAEKKTSIGALLVEVLK